MYLNLAPYGNQVVGAGRASRAYFGRDPALLTPAQAALLAGLTQRPSGFDPYRQTGAAFARQRVIIRRMEAAGLLTASAAALARQERLAFRRDASPFLAPHFVEMVLASLPRPRPDRVVTTLDARLQDDVAGIIAAHRPTLERHGAANVAVVVLDNARGEWLAWEGSGAWADADRGGTINGAAVPRQPGSALKPFTYALAFEHGHTPASVLPDVPSHFPTAEAGVLYSPRNYDGRYRGPLLARRALAGSENVPAVALASEVGVPSLLRFLTRAGLTTFDRNAAHYGLGLTLGNAEVRLDELTAAYASFARGGEWIAPTWTRRTGAPETRRLVTPLTAYWITDILSDAEAREYIFGRGGSLELPFPVAVKTGTSQAYHDNWTIGYTRELTVGVWVGNFDRRPLRSSSGVTGAGPIFHATMLAAARRRYATDHAVGDRPIVARPDALQEHGICALSGMRASAWCPSTRREWLPGDDSLPCSWHHQADGNVIVVWPAEYRQWARENGRLEKGRAPRPLAASESMPAAGRAAAARAPQSLEIANPPSGATFLIDPTLRREFQAVPLRVMAAQPGPVEWRVNGSVVGSGSSESPFLWPLVPGEHVISAHDGRGRTAQARITVK
jgi:penicillin-binding protein 1C